MCLYPTKDKLPRCVITTAFISLMRRGSNGTNFCVLRNSSSYHEKFFHYGSEAIQSSAIVAQSDGAPVNGLKLQAILSTSLLHNWRQLHNPGPLFFSLRSSDLRVHKTNYGNSAPYAYFNTKYKSWRPRTLESCWILLSPGPWNRDLCNVRDASDFQFSAGMGSLMGSGVGY